MIRPCGVADFTTILEIVNQSAMAYKGVIPSDRWHEPYFDSVDLALGIDKGIEFWVWEEKKQILGVMGLQRVEDVTLIRHAYVRPEMRGKGVGRALLSYLLHKAAPPILVGTWKAAYWAIRFYERNNFEIVPDDEGADLQRKYWKVPERQVEESVVLQWKGH
jgi:GNAT superfamily N-acetyltransferase